MTTLIAYDGWKPILEWDEWGNLQAWNIYGAGPDEILYRHDATRGELRYHLDRMGNVAFLLDADGDGIEKYTYDAFGQPTVTDWDGTNPRTWSAYGNRFMFTGREYFAELGLYDYRNRFYYPTLGRFLQTDPTGFDAGDMNLFRYCDDDPVDRSDPMGLYAVLVIDFDRGLQNGLSRSMTGPDGAGTQWTTGVPSAAESVALAGSGGQNGMGITQQAPENYNPSQLQHSNDPRGMICKGASEAYNAGQGDKREYHIYVFQNPDNPKDFVSTPLRVSGKNGTRNETYIGYKDKDGNFHPSAAVVANYKFWGVGMNHVRYNKGEIIHDLGTMRANGFNGTIMTPSPPSSMGPVHSPPYSYDAERNSTYGP